LEKNNKVNSYLAAIDKQAAYRSNIAWLVYALKSDGGILFNKFFSLFTQ
jgi:hypothetical protein